MGTLDREAKTIRITHVALEANWETIIEDYDALHIVPVVGERTIDHPHADDEP